MMRFGLIGYGLWGRHHARAIAKAPGATLAAIACRTPESAAAARRDFPGVPVHLDHRELLDRPDVEVVDVVVPNDLHAAIGVAALEHGKDVLLEKPLAPTLAECDRLIVAARRTGRVLSVGHELRLSSQWGGLKTLIDAGDLGDPRRALVSLFRFPYRPGSGGWRHQPSRIGSWIMEELVHHFDLLLWYFAGAGDPIAVVAAGHPAPASALATPAGGVPGRAVPAAAASAAPARAEPPGAWATADNFSCLLRFPGQRHAVVAFTLAAFEYHLLVEVVGAEGAARGWWSGTLDRTREAAFELRVKRRGAPAPETLPLGPSGELVELEAQLRLAVAAFSERRALVPPEDARRAVAVCLAAEASLREGREVAVSW